MPVARIRAETPADIASVRAVNLAAFPGPEEADLVDRLRADGDVVVSLVATAGGAAVGHVLFSRLPIETAGGIVAGAALAPVAVLPERQRQGIGGALVREGLRRCRAAGIAAAVVLGHPGYYPRFGFSAAAAHRLRAPFSGEAFMALALAPGALDAPGTLRYARAFGLGPPT
jgi:putative acetyltransferase